VTKERCLDVVLCLYLLLIYKRWTQTDYFSSNKIARIDNILESSDKSKFCCFMTISILPLSMFINKELKYMIFDVFLICLGKHLLFESLNPKRYFQIIIYTCYGTNCLWKIQIVAYRTCPSTIGSRRLRHHDLLSISRGKQWHWRV